MAQSSRYAELLAQLRPQDNTRGVQTLIDRSRDCDIKMRRGLIETRQLLYGRNSDDENYNAAKRSKQAPWELDSDEDSDDGRRDKSYLTPDGKQVVQRQYKLINGHWAFITYRKELHEVDPALLLKLQEEREKELAKERRKAEPTREQGIFCEQGISPVSWPSRNFINEARAAIVRDHQSQQGVKRWDPPLNRYETPTPPASPPLPDESDFQKMLDMRRREAEKASEEEELRRWREIASAPLPTSFQARGERVRIDLADELFYRPEWDFEYEKDLKNWAEGFDKDILYEYLDDSDTADSCATVHKAPIREPEPKASRKSCLKSPSHLPDDEEEDLDIWLKIADEDNEGKKPHRRVRFQLPPRRHK
ncbi:hypothetical protein GGR51DRAFT_569936 [Nemania sp. FL0031]|nr:hypothetical protein GGR51DRAFT_569936 [Nemania sp. FL0031]